jgi:hypothetical protein
MRLNVTQPLQYRLFDIKFSLAHFQHFHRTHLSREVPFRNPGVSRVLAPTPRPTPLYTSSLARERVRWYRTTLCRERCRVDGTVVRTTLCRMYSKGANLT